MEEIFGVANTLKAMSHDYEGTEFFVCYVTSGRCFTYPTSTRTFLSFLTACQLVGITTGEVYILHYLPEYKGESQEDAIRLAATSIL